MIHRVPMFGRFLILLCTPLLCAWTLEASPAHSAFQVQGAPGAIVHAPDGFDAEAPLHLVVFLHGYNGCARVLAKGGPQRCRPGAPERQGWDLSARHDLAGTNTLLVVPQLAFMKRHGRPGCFGQAACFRHFIDELLRDGVGPKLGRRLGIADLASLTLLAHSAGYRAARAVLRQGGLGDRITHVVLLDALYGHAEHFAAWVADSPVVGRRLVSIYLNDGETYRESRRLLGMTRRRLGREAVGRARHEGLAPAIARFTVVVASGRGRHREVPQNYLSTVLAALGLPMRASEGTGRP